jgi:hypothetical protein
LERSVGQLGLGLLFLSAYKSHAGLHYILERTKSPIGALRLLYKTAPTIILI